MNTSTSVSSNAAPRGKPRRLFFLAALLLSVLTAAGCSETPTGRVPVHKTSGVITVDGRAPEGALIVLHPKSPAGDAPSASGRVKNDGTFELTTYETGDGAPEGEFVVTLDWRKLEKVNGEFVLGPNLAPKAYTRPATSNAVVRVASGMSVLPKLEIKRK